MTLARDVSHHIIEDPALPYDVARNPLSSQPRFISGENILTSYKNKAERRPGFADFETTPVVLPLGTERIFTWRRWAGSFFVMVSTRAQVYKLEIGVDASFVSIHTATVSVVFDFVVSNNHVFFGNGTDMKKYDGTTVTNWGIVAPVAAPTTALAAGTISATTGFEYVYTYGNSNTGHESSPSPASASTGVFAGPNSVDVTVVASTDAQVDEIHVYRTTDGGGGIQFEIGGSPFANTSGAKNDDTTDVNLSTQQAPIPGFNDPPPPSRGFKWYVNRIWMFVGNRVWYTGWEEIQNGVEEESVPSGADGNFWAFDSETTGIGVVEDGVLPFTSGRVYKIDGDSQDTFRRTKLVDNLGLRNQAGLASFGRITAWLDSSDSVWVTDGLQVDEVSIPIRPDLKGINHSQAALAIHVDGDQRWLCVLDGGLSKIRVYDLDMERWLPPWTIAGKAIHSGETSVGEFDLLLGHSSNKVLKMTPTAYLDNGSSYSAFLATGLFDVVPREQPGRLGNFEYVGYERNVIAETSVGALIDDNPLTVGHTTIAAASIQDPDRRTQGTAIIEKRAYLHEATKRSGRRVSLRMDWAAADSNFELYSLDIAFQVME